MIRPPKKIVLSREIKRFIKNHRKPKKSFHYSLLGRKSNVKAWIIDKMVEANYETVCPSNSKPLKKVGNVIGIIHSHPNDDSIPSDVDLKSHPVNKICIILGRGNPTYWFKTKDYLIEIKEVE